MRAGNMKSDSTSPRNDTLCRFGGRWAWIWRSASGGVDGRGVDQQDRNAVLDRIHPAAFAAFQARRIFFQDERLLASRANQDVEQILRNHDE
jgi:hypothetical protein